MSMNTCGAILLVAFVVSGCSSTAVRCDGELTPINTPAVVEDGKAANAAEESSTP
jgi:hypothetical protein